MNDHPFSIALTFVCGTSAMVLAVVPPHIFIRAVVFIEAVVLFGCAARMVYERIHELRTAPKDSTLVYVPIDLGIMFLGMRNLMTQIVNFGQPIHWYTSPLDAIVMGLLIAWIVLLRSSFARRRTLPPRGRRA